MLGGGKGNPPGPPGGGNGMPAGGEPAAPGVGGGKGNPPGGGKGIPFGGGNGNGGMPRPAGPGGPPGPPNGGGGMPGTDVSMPIKLSVSCVVSVLPFGGKPKGGGMPKGVAPMGPLPGSIGFWLAWPASVYEAVMESITDCAFSCPISAFHQSNSSPVKMLYVYISLSSVELYRGMDVR